MSAIFQYLQSSVRKYVSSENGDVDQLRQEFAGAYMYIRNHSREEATGRGHHYARSWQQPSALLTVRPM
jgi:hypothetical protein